MSPFNLVDVVINYARSRRYRIIPTEINPTRPPSPRLVIIPVRLPTISPPTKGTALPKITCSTTATAINKSPS